MSSSSAKSLGVPEYLKVPHIGVTEISLTQRSLLFRFNVSSEMKGEIKVIITGKWETDCYQLKDRAARKGYTPENIELLVKGFSHIYSGEAADTIAQIRNWRTQQSEAEKITKASKTNGEKKPKVIKHYLQKYHDPNSGLELYEAVLVGKDAFFLSIDRDVAKTKEGQVGWRLSAGFNIANAITNTVTEILPKESLAYTSKPYQFESEKEIEQFFQKASELTLDQLYNIVKTIIKKYIAASNTHHTILAADIIFSYFQDIFGQTHYLYFYGDNGSGKTINLQLLSLLGFRPMYDVDVTAANIFTYYGTIEEGQGIILEDEADDLDYKQQEKMKIYKKGYNAGGKVSRTETGGDSGRIQEGYYVFGFKAFTGEERLDSDYAKGFNERTFYIKCVAGDPQYDLSEVTSPAGSEEHKALLQELEGLHKALLMYRLIHHTDKFPNIEIAVKNREKQLTKPLIRLFQGTKSLEEIAKALGELIAERRGLKRDTLEYAVYKVVSKLITERKDANTRIFTARLIYQELKSELDGKYRDEDKDQSFETPNHGKVSHKKINSICEDRFGAKKHNTNHGYEMTFNEQSFTKVKEAYELDDTGVKILFEDRTLCNYNVNGSCGASVKVVQVPEDKGPASEEKIISDHDGIQARNEKEVKNSHEIGGENEENEGEKK